MLLNQIICFYESRELFVRAYLVLYKGLLDLEREVIKMEYRNKEKSIKISTRFLFAIFFCVVIVFGLITGKLDPSAIINILVNFI